MYGKDILIIKSYWIRFRKFTVLNWSDLNKAKKNALCVFIEHLKNSPAQGLVCLDFSVPKMSSLHKTKKLDRFDTQKSMKYWNSTLGTSRIFILNWRNQPAKQWWSCAANFLIKAKDDFCVIHLLVIMIGHNLWEISSKSLLRRDRRTFPKIASQILNGYYYGNQDNRYPCHDEKEALAKRCGISVAQVSTWFGNKRIREKNALKKYPSKDKL